MRLLAIPFLLLTFPALAQSGQDITQEPPTILEVTVNGQTQRVHEGQDFDVSGGKASIRVSEVKTLVTDKVSFDYPRHFAFEYDGSVPGMRQWSLDGNNVVLMLFEVEGEGEVKDFEEGMAERFGKKNCKGRDTSLKLGGKDLKGRRLDIALAGAALSVDIVKIPADDGRTRLLFVQDTKTDTGSSSDESQHALSLLDRTIRYQ